MRYTMSIHMALFEPQEAGKLFNSTRPWHKGRYERRFGETGESGAGGNKSKNYTELANISFGEILNFTAEVFYICCKSAWVSCSILDRIALSPSQEALHSTSSIS